MPVSTAEPVASTIPAASAPAASGKPAFESWGRYPRHNARVVQLHWQSDFPSILAGSHDSALPVGMGRSYGDVCQLNGGTLVQTTGMNRLLDFDP